MSCPKVIIFFLFGIFIITNCKNKVDEVGSVQVQIEEPSHVEPIVNYLPSDKINPEELDTELLILLIEEGINIKRIEEGPPVLQSNEILSQAAQLQNQYQVQIGKLSHFQNDVTLENVQDRVLHFKGQFKSVGENVQYQGFQTITRNGVSTLVRPIYKEASQLIVRNWIASPGHYKNLINKDFDQVGTAVGWSPEKKAIFATQVFGG